MWVSNSNFVCSCIDFVHDWIIAYASSCVLGSYQYIPTLTFIFCCALFYIWPIKATWLLSEIVEGPSIWTFWYHLVWIQNLLLWPTLFSHCFVVVMLIINIASTWLFINNSTASSCELSTCTGFCLQNCFLSYIVPNF